MTISICSRWAHTHMQNKASTSLYTQIPTYTVHYVIHNTQIKIHTQNCRLQHALLQGAWLTLDSLCTCPPTGAQPESYTVPTGHCAAAAVSLWQFPPPPRQEGGEEDDHWRLPTVAQAWWAFSQLRNYGNVCHFVVGWISGWISGQVVELIK